MDAAVVGDALVSFDLVAIEGLLRVCDLELVLLDGTSPRAAISSMIKDQALICTVEIGARTRGRFVLPVDWCLLGYLQLAEETDSWCHGIPLSSGSILTVMPEGTSEFVLGAGSRMTFLLVPVARIQERMTQHQLGGLDNRAGPVPVVSSPRNAMIEEYYELLGQDMARGSLQSSQIERVLDMHVEEVMQQGRGERSTCTRSRRVRYLILRRAEDFMRANLRRHIYTQELCDAAGVSERALRYAFEELVGTSPTRYLSMLRLCEACRSLSSADASRRSVKSVALSCGLWDLSRFADNYRRVFGELPRDTLMRGALVS